MCRLFWSNDQGKYRKVVSATWKPGHKWCRGGWAAKLDCGHERLLSNPKHKKPTKGLCYACGQAALHIEVCVSAKLIKVSVSA